MPPRPDGIPRVAGEAELDALRTEVRPDEVSHRDWAQEVRARTMGLVHGLGPEDSDALAARMRAPRPGDELARWLASRSFAGDATATLSDPKRRAIRRAQQTGARAGAAPAPAALPAPTRDEAAPYGPEPEDEPQPAPRPARRDPDAAPADPAEVDAITAADPAQTPSVAASLGGYTHVVASGDTLDSIARDELGSTTYVGELLRANPQLSRRRALHPGDEVEIPALDVPLLAAMRNFAHDDVGLHHLVTHLTDTEWATFLAETRRRGRDDEALIARAQMVRTTDKTFGQMAASQRAFMERRAEDTGESVGTQLAAEFDKWPRTPGVEDDWREATDEQRALWTASFPAVRDAVLAVTPPEVLAMLDAHPLVWEPESMGASNYTLYSRGVMLVGVAWLVDAQKDPTSVIPTFVHEAQGHPSYAKDPDQDYLASGVFNGVFESLPEDEQAKALKGAGPIGYGYFETEIFAELMEWGYDTPQSASDHAFDVAPDGKEYDDGRVKEVEAFLKLIRDDLEPTVADGVLSGLWLRIQRDERIIPAARGLFYATAVEVFGHEP
ncbi:MAG: LysM peptidoglycan-binding domain-containing protein [Kofleriaceae bacterium]|nr:LysM peptidoglycan-binding domain-containing protein [Kofleriaceae bacterium]